MKPTGISEGKPIFNFFKVGTEGMGKLYSPDEGGNFPFWALFAVTCEK